MFLLKDDHGLMPGTCDSVALHGKRNRADVMKLKILRSGSVLNHPAGPDVVKRVKAGGARESLTETQPATAGFEDGRRPKAVKCLLF